MFHNFWFSFYFQTLLLAHVRDHHSHKAQIHSGWCEILTLGTCNQVCWKRDGTETPGKIQTPRCCFSPLASFDTNEIKLRFRQSRTYSNKDPSLTFFSLKLAEGKSWGNSSPQPCRLPSSWDPQKANWREEGEPVRFAVCAHCKFCSACCNSSGFTFGCLAYSLHNCLADGGNLPWHTINTNSLNT